MESRALRAGKIVAKRGLCLIKVDKTITELEDFKPLSVERVCDWLARPRKVVTSVVFVRHSLRYCANYCFS